MTELLIDSTSVPTCGIITRGTRAILVVAAMTTLSTSVEAVSQFRDTSSAPLVRPASARSIAMDRPDISAVARIRALGTYSSGWKGPGSSGPSEGAVSDAEAFARTLFLDHLIARPHIGLTADGEVNFYWKTPAVTVDLSVLGDGTYTYFAQPRSGASIAGDDVPIGEKLPSSLLELLKSA